MRNDEFVDAVALAPGKVPEDLASFGPVVNLTLFPAPHKWMSRGAAHELPWKTTLEHLSEPELWPGAETVQAGSDRLPAWSFATFRDNTRVVARDPDLSARETRARVLHVHGLVIDYIDEPAVDGTHLMQWWGRFAFVAYSSGFNDLPMGDRPEGPRWRLLLPFSEPVDLETATRVAHWVRHSRHAVGIVDACAEEPWRLFTAPAVGPGGYRWCASNAAALDPHHAIKELEDWRVLDIRLRAARHLEGTDLPTALALLRSRREVPSRRPVFPGFGLPELDSLIGRLWPGRVVALLGSGGSGRTGLVTQLVDRAASVDLPVLMVLTRSGPEDVVARMINARSSASLSEVLDGTGEGVGASIEALSTRCASLHLWAPIASQRTLEALVEKVRALHDAKGGVPPLVVVDGVEGWAVEDPEAGARSLVAGLRDVARSGTLSPDWPGAAVVFVAGMDGPATSTADLIESWQDGTLDRGRFEADASVIVVVALSGHDGVAVVAKNREGNTGQVLLRYDAGKGRFLAP